MFNRKLKEENTRLKYRIKELEEKLCPCSDHDWKFTGANYQMNGCFDVDIIYYYKCTRCGKEIRTFFEKENTK